MKKRLIVVIICLHGLNVFSQTLYPTSLPITQFTFKNKASKLETYPFSTSEKKAFLFFDIKSEPFAEVMYNGAVFVFNNSPISIFPIYFTGQLNKKTGQNFPSKIPTQICNSPLKSEFKNFNITEADFPLLLVYNEKNELCGFAKTTEQISEINCGIEQEISKFLRLKILTESKSGPSQPYAFKPIVILGGDLQDTITKITTNQYGDFDAMLPNLNQDYIITVNEKDPTINFVVLSTQSGKKIGNFKSTDKGFEYRILKLDLLKLPDIYIEEDISLKLKTLDKKETDNFAITENLFYELGASSLSTSSKELLDKMVLILKNYPQFKITVISHTDSQGDESANLKLSIKRAEEVAAYFFSKGISKDRLIAIGKGETEIRNRCVNNIDCSNKEHEYNRRTEFKFTKK